MAFSPLKSDCQSLPLSRRIRCDASPGRCPLIEFCRFVPFPRVWCDTSFVDSFSFPAIKKADREQRSAGCLFVISTASMKKCGQLYLFGFLEEECIVQGAVFAVPIMHYAGLPPDKNKRFRSFRSNTAFLHPILLSTSYIAVSLFR